MHERLIDADKLDIELTKQLAHLKEKATLTTTQIEFCQGRAIGFALAKQIVDNAPIATTNDYAMGYRDAVRKLARPTSYWVDDERGTTCHNCGSLSRRWSKFCPDCGTQMDKERKINPFDHRGITEI